MVLEIKKGDSQEKINEILSELNKRSISRGIDAKTYCGIIKLKENPVIIQKKMRNEWKYLYI